MPRRRLPVREIGEVLRLQAQGPGQREIGQSVAAGLLHPAPNPNTSPSRSTAVAYLPCYPAARQKACRIAPRSLRPRSSTEVPERPPRIPILDPYPAPNGGAKKRSERNDHRQGQTLNEAMRGVDNFRSPGILSRPEV